MATLGLLSNVAMSFQKIESCKIVCSSINKLEIIVTDDRVDINSFDLTTL